jgi:hypothetical protein
MDITEYTYYFKHVGQLNYGQGDFGQGGYSCQTSDTDCTTTSTQVGVPNTGVASMPQSALIATSVGGLLIAVAVVGIVFIIINRVRRKDS